MKAFAFLFMLALAPIASEENLKDGEMETKLNTSCRCFNCKCTLDKHCGCKAKSKTCCTSTQNSCPFGKNKLNEKEEKDEGTTQQGLSTQ